MIESTGRDGKIYRIGVRSFIIGNQYMANKGVVDIAKPKVEQLGNKYAKTVFIAEDSLGHVVYVYKYQPKFSTVMASCVVGSRNDYHNTALGKCMLAFREDCLNLIDQYIDENKIQNKDKFLEQIIQIRKRKYVHSDQEHEHQLFCTAVPIFDHKGVVASVISLSGLYESEQNCTDEIKDLKKVAAEISQELGFIGEY